MASSARSLAWKRRHKRVGFWLGTSLLCFCLPAYGVDRERKLSELHHTSWTYADGAPGEVWALAQTTDGYLWLGTATGLFRFDGIRFQRFTPLSGPAFAQRVVYALLAVPDGGLWVGYRTRGASFINHGTATHYGTAEGLPTGMVRALARDRRGVIWLAASQDGLARFDGSRWSTVGSDWGFEGEAHALLVDHAGTLWVGTPTSVASLAEGGRRFQIVARGLLPLAQAFAEAPDGAVWMAEGGYGVRRVPSSEKDSRGLVPAVMVGSLGLTFDDQGSLWVTSFGDGIRRVAHPERLSPPTTKGSQQFHSPLEVEAFTDKDGLTSDLTYSILQDREGNVWIGTSAGLDRFRQSPVVTVPIQPLSTRNERPIPSHNSFATSAMSTGNDGGLWVGGLGPQVLVKIQNDTIAAQMRDLPVDSTYRDAKGVIWFSTPTSIMRLADDRVETVDTPKAGGIAVSPPSRARGITQDPRGRLWLAMPTGTFRVDGLAWTSLESLGGPKGKASALFTDSLGRIWFGFRNTVVILDGESVRTFSSNDGVEVGFVSSIQSRGKTIWIGGEFGLAFLEDNRFQQVNALDGSVFSGVSGIIAETEDGLWFSDNQGIVHIREDQLRVRGSGQVEFERYGFQDGLTAALRGAFAFPSSVQTTDGRMWFATSNGVAWIDPGRLVRNTVPPPVIIESVVANGGQHDSSKLVGLPPRTTNLQITYTATSLTIPERVRFRYMLEGQDSEWQDVGTRREAFYTNLGPGTYRFRVIASNNDGVWNETGASLNFSIAPSYHQTNWFRAAFGVMVWALLWALYQFRLRQIAHAFNARLDERVGERTRIARELHDTLLQSFQGLMLRFQSARNLLPAEPERAVEALDGALDRADQALAEGRDAVQNLRSSTPAVTELAQAMSALAEECAQRPNGERCPVTFRMSVVGRPRDLHPLIRDDIYRIAGEALRNAYRHAQARQIEAEVTCDAHEVRVRIRDDGRGIDPQHLAAGRSGHWGLINMRERAEQIGSKLSLWSEVGAGTEVELRIPRSVAYGSSRGRGSWWRNRMQGATDER